MNENINKFFNYYNPYKLSENKSDVIIGLGLTLFFVFRDFKQMEKVQFDYFDLTKLQKAKIFARKFLVTLFFVRLGQFVGHEYLTPELKKLKLL